MGLLIEVGEVDLNKSGCAPQLLKHLHASNEGRIWWAAQVDGDDFTSGLAIRPGCIVHILLEQRSTSSLIEAILKFEEKAHAFRVELLREHALSFSRARCKAALKEFLLPGVKE